MKRRDLPKTALLAIPGAGWLVDKAVANDAKGRLIWCTWPDGKVARDVADEYENQQPLLSVTIDPA